MKKFIASMILICAVSIASANPPVSDKVLKQFTSAFPSVKDAKWFESEDHFDVYFEKDEVKYQIRYNKAGKIVSTRNYYGGAKLCSFIKTKLAEKFSDKTIFGVTEITNSDEMYYVVVLEDDNSWTNVRCDATGRMEVLEKLKKAK
jgi:inorganic pyrophosphatase/exopolyphosphatase